MNNNIFICGHHNLKDILGASAVPCDVLLITNPGRAGPEEVLLLARRVLHLQFDDASGPRHRAVLPTSDDIRRALEWVDAGAGADLVVACHAGISRSSALAYVVRCHTTSPREALALLKRGMHRPNELIVRLGADLLAQPEVYHAYEDWMTRDR